MSEYSDGADIHCYLQPDWYEAVRSPSVWLSAQSSAARHMWPYCKSDSDFPFFHSCAGLRGPDWPLFQPREPFFIGWEKSNRKEIAPKFTEKWRVECLLPLIKIWPSDISQNFTFEVHLSFVSKVSVCALNHPQFKCPCENAHCVFVLSVVVSFVLMLFIQMWAIHALCFGLCPPHRWHSEESLGSFCSLTHPHVLSPSPLGRFPLSHLIAFDKCPYWLHIIRCSEGSLRLYCSAHIAHLFPLLWGWHVFLQSSNTAKGNSFMSQRFTSWRVGLISAYSLQHQLHA